MELSVAVALTGILLGLAGPAVPAPETAAEALARKVEERHRSATDLIARFEQTYKSGLLSRQVVESGIVSLKPPGRMLWEYRQPEKKTFVSDGKTFYFYVPADRQVMVRDQADTRGVPALLLSGRGNILTLFAVALETGAPGLQRLRLTPRTPDPEVEWVQLDVDESHRIRAILIVDAQGNRSQFRFDDIKENVGLKDTLFRFRIPPGVEVISG